MSARDSCALRVIPWNESWVAERTLDRGAQQVPWQHQQVTLCFGVHARASLAEAFGLLHFLAPGASRDIARHLHQTPDKADASPWVITSSERVIKERRGSRKMSHGGMRALRVRVAHCRCLHYLRLNRQYELEWPLSPGPTRGPRGGP